MLFQNLKNFWLSIKRDKFLLIALFIGLILRGMNPTFGSPSLYVSNDEAIAHLSALNMIAYKTPVSIANYTPLGAYVQIPFLVASFLAMKILGYVSGISDYELFVLTHEGYFLFIPRLISVLFGTLTILVIYKMTLALYGEKKIGIIAAFLTSVSFNLVHISHFGRPWSAALFFFTLAIYLSLKNKTLLSYISIGLSYGFHQAGILFLSLIFSISYKSRTPGKIISLIICLLLIFLFSSLTLKTGFIESVRDGQSFIRPHVLITDFLAGDFDLVNSTVNTVRNNLSYYFLTNLLFTDGIILILGILGFVKCMRENLFCKKIVFYILLYFLFASLFFHPLIRYLLPILILTIPFAAHFISFTFKKNVFIVLIIFISSINSLWWNYLYIRKPTFIEARDWIIENINPGVAILYTGTRFRSFLPNSEALSYMHDTNSNFYLRLEKVLNGMSSDNVRNIIYLNVFPGQSKFYKFRYADEGYDIKYVVDYYIDPSERLFNLIPNNFEIVKEFNPTRDQSQIGIAEPLFDASWNFPVNDRREKVSMYSLLNAGPYVDILKVKN